MKRREFLTIGTATASLPAIAGCSSDEDETRGYTYTLTFSDGADETMADRLDFDRMGMAPSQEDIVAEAARTGSYSEENVTWDSLPGQQGITMEFRMVIQLIARHVDRDPQVDSETSFEAPSRYEGRPYRAVVDVA